VFVHNQWTRIRSADVPVGNAVRMTALLFQMERIRAIRDRSYVEKIEDVDENMKRNPQTGVKRNRPLDRLRGMDDVLPPATYRLREVVDTLSEMAESHGYQLIDVPLLEPTELFLRKSGEALAPKLYAFNLANRDICVRPEFTASVGRLFVDQLQDAPLPQRLYYSGPVLRHEKPQRGRRRQFTQLGLELIGADGPTADAEVILAACDGLNALGIGDYRVVLGHIGATLEMLEHLELDLRARNFVLSNLENLARSDRGLPFVEERLATLYPLDTEMEPEEDLHLTAGMPQEDARLLITSLLNRLDADVALGSRSVDEIVENMLDRFSRPNQVPLIRQALGLAGQLHALSGPPGVALPAAAELLARHQISETPLRELEEIVSFLKAADLPEDSIEVNLGFGRGLHYYTGMIFEMYSTDPEVAGRQLCGGGRYDDLITSMGGRKLTPACGFAYGIQRLTACLPEAEIVPKVDLLVTAEDGNMSGALLRIARRLRETGLGVETDARGRKGRSAAQYASRREIRYLLTLAGEDAPAACQVWDRETGHKQDFGESELVQWAEQLSTRRPREEP